MERIKGATQQQVADKAGVSRATVSYVLNDKNSQGVPISEETRKKVLTAISDLGYQPNLQARTLRSGRTYTIGVLVLDMHNPHFWQYLSGVEAEAHRNGYTIMVFNTELKLSEENVALRELTRKRIDGAIVNASYGKSAIQGTNELALSGLPVVDISSHESSFDHILSDYRAATNELMTYLFDLGHRRYGFLCGIANIENGLDRLEPYQTFLNRKAIPEDSAQVVVCEPTQDAAYSAALSLLKQPNRPTAVVAINDYLAMSVLRAAADLGIRVPKDLSVCGFDDIPFSSFLIPRLTTVRKDTEQAGVRAFQLLLDRMNGMTGPVRIERIEASLEIRESTGPAPD